MAAAKEEIVDNKHWTHLTPEETLDAITIDFQQYPPQPHLLNRLNRFIFPTRPHGGEEVSIEQGFFFLLHHLETTPLQILARVAEMVFETRTAVDSKENGIWIKDQMGEFDCIICGDCCKELFYQNGCTREDVHQWRIRGRQDILERVKVRTTAPGGKTQYQIWWDAHGDRMFSQCPWLAPLPQNQGFHCRIHRDKPMVCRQYPFTRKHARMTGCPGRFRPCHREAATETSTAFPKPVSTL